MIDVILQILMWLTVAIFLYGIVVVIRGYRILSRIAKAGKEIHKGKQGQ